MTNEGIFAQKFSFSSVLPRSSKDAQVAFFIVTDKQYDMVKEFFATPPTRKKPNMPEQVELFYF